MSFEEELKTFKENFQVPVLKNVGDYKLLLKEIQKIVIEKALNAELEAHLDNDDINSRNGYSSKTIQTENGKLEITTLRDRNSTFEPILVKKGQRKISCMGMTRYYPYMQEE